MRESTVFSLIQGFSAQIFSVFWEGEMPREPAVLPSHQNIKALSSHTQYS